MFLGINMFLALHSENDSNSIVILASLRSRDADIDDAVKMVAVKMAWHVHKWAQQPFFTASSSTSGSRDLKLAIAVSKRTFAV